jgi:protein O-mannosyl-transferase
MRKTKEGVKKAFDPRSQTNVASPSGPADQGAERTAPIQRQTRGRLALVCLGLAAAVVMGFWPVHRYEFVNLDDPFYITDNSLVRTGLSWTNVPWALRDTHLGTWHPLTWVSHMLDVQLYGLNAGGHHLTNVLFHTANTLLLFLLLRRATATIWRSALVAALFGLHPLHVESVAWVSERKDVLSTFFFLLTLLAYGRYVRKAESTRQKAEPGRHFLSSGDYWLSLLWFALGLMSKPMLVTVPLLLLILDYWPLKRNAEFGVREVEAEAGGILQGRTLPWMKLVREKVPFFALALADGLITLWSQHRAGAVKTVTDLPLAGGVPNALISYARYLWKTVWPANLSVFYPFERHWPGWLVAGAVVLLLALSGLAMAQARRRPWLLAGWLWYIITVTPVIGFIQVGGQSAADRYTYIPLIGIFIALVWCVGEMVQRANRQNLAAVGGVSLVALALFGAHAQVRHWRSSETLFRHALAVTPGNALAHHSLGSALYERGQLAEAAAEFRQALKIRPDHQTAGVGLGIVLAAQGELGEAARCFRMVLKQHPDDAEAHFQYGNVLSREGKAAEAILQYMDAVLLKPGLAPAQNNLANALQRAGQMEEAIAHYQAALRAAPDLAEAHNNLGRALATQGKTAEAMAEYEAALRSKPDYAEAWNNLGNALAQQGKMDEAITNYLGALRHKPLYAKAENSLGCALAAKGNVAAAVQHFSKALDLEPNSVEAHFNLANALAGQGKRAEARTHFAAAVRLQPTFARAHRQLAELLAADHQDCEALAHFQEALRLQPEDGEALRGLASLCASSTDVTVRNPTEAVRLAERADELTGGADAKVLDTLAAAYVAAGQRSDAIEATERAIAAARSSGQTNLLGSLEARLKGLAR